MSELTLPAIAAIASATSVLLGHMVFRNAKDTRRRATREEYEWNELYDMLIREQVASIKILVYATHAELRSTYRNAPSKEEVLVLPEVALFARNLTRFPCSVAISKVNRGPCSDSLG